MRARRPLLLIGTLGLLLFPDGFAGAREGEETEAVSPAQETEGAPSSSGVTRRRPGSKPESEGAQAPPPLPTLPYEFLPVPDRWRISGGLGVEERWWDPYHFNVLKSDRPLFGENWFLNVRAVSDSVFEPRRLPTPVGLQASERGGTLDAFGDGEQYLLNENLILSLSLIEGNTVFRPPDWEFRATGVWNFNYTSVETVGLVNVDPTFGTRRYDHDFAIQELFADRHVANVSERYDFFSVRAGVQGFATDFRGFLFADNQPGVRVFGNYLDNRLQWNVAAFRRLEKDINSGLNSTFDLRHDDVYVVNAFYQDFPVLGFTLQGTVVYNRNSEGSYARKFDQNGFLQRPAVIGSARPHDYDITYFGLNGDGHFGRVNLTFAAYYGHGEDEHQPIADRRTTIDDYMGAAEASMDFDWYRLKAFGLYASGDDDPFDDEAGGWDPIFENPNFAGGETSFWVRQGIPFIGGGGVQLVGRNAIIPSLRSSKEQGQSNFVNPGLRLAGVGADFDVLPELRLLANVSWLAFDDTATLEVLRNQAPIDREIGWDVSGGIVWRPLFIENVVLRLSGAVLFPEDGFEQLFDDREKDPPFYSVLANLVLTY